MEDIKRNDIHLVARHSNMSAATMRSLLRRFVYNDAQAWKKFLNVFFISLGAGFCLTGIIFFFAYNWADLHKFIKLGLIGGLIISGALAIVFSKINLLVRNIVLTGISALVGVMFAVFGQIYQTGANAYDFFLGWTLFISLWVFISDFAALWLVYILLLNTTIVLYSQQVAWDWSGVFVLTILVLLDSVFLTAVRLLAKFRQFRIATWFSDLLGFAVVVFATTGIVMGIFDENEPSLFLLLVITAALYVLGILNGLREKRTFYIAIIPFSLIIILSSAIIETSGDASMFFTTSVFVVATVSMVVWNLLRLQKKWNHERGE